MIVLVFYVVLFVGCYIAVRMVRRAVTPAADFNSLKTVTFGDESAVKADRAASILSVLCLFFIWGAFTNSSLVPLHVPGPYSGETQFTYSARNAEGDIDTATVFITVAAPGEEEIEREVEPGDGPALNDFGAASAWGSVLVRVTRNDEDGYEVFAINDSPISANERVAVEGGEVVLTPRGSLNFVADSGLQMQPIWLPPPESIASRLVEIANSGYQNSTLIEHLWASLYRVLGGFFFGALLGIPLGYAMGLSPWFRGWFDPIVEFMRPVPPLALIPLVIIWFGIGEQGKIVLLFLAALWIMTIAARAGVAGVNISKIHAAYSLGASKVQILWHVIVPNSLPEIFTGARVAMGVCWGTVVAAELVAATEGAGMMIIAASRFQLTDIVILGIILIGLIGFGIDILMRAAENVLVPWKGKS